MKLLELLGALGLGLFGIPLVLAGVHVALGTPSSPHHDLVVERPLVAIVGGRAEHCLPESWPGVSEHPSRPTHERVVNLARRDTDWRAVLAQIDFIRDTAPVGILVVAIDPEQLLYDRSTHAGHRPDPDPTRRAGFIGGGAGARIYGVFDRWLSLPGLLDRHILKGATRYDSETWGTRQGRHWADPDGLIGLRRAIALARHEGVEVVPVLLPLPPAAIEAWRASERGGELERIRGALAEMGAIDHLESAAELDAYFPDGVGCARQTGRTLLDQLARR